MRSRLRCHLGKATAGGLLVLVGVTGCSTEQRATTPESAETAQPDYTVEQARQGPIDLVTDTTELLGSDNWESSSVAPWPGFCKTSENEEGASYSYNLRTAQRPDDVAADVQKVVDYWESLGVSTRIVDHGEYPTVYATGGPVVRASFMSKIPGADRYEVGAVGGCAPGDIFALQDEERQRRADREVIPGADKYKVGAVGGCAPGDSLELMQVENDRAEQREIIPGDSYFPNHPPEDTEADEGDADIQPSEQID